MNVFRVCFFVLLGLVSLAAPALAQTTSADPRARAYATELVRMTKANTDMQEAFSQMAGGILGLIARDNPNQDVVVKDVFQQSVEKAFAAHMQEFESNAVSLYAEAYTADELRQILDFYKTPVGQKMLRTMQQTMQKSVEVNMPVFKAALQEAAAITVQTLRARGLNVPKEFTRQ